MLLHDVFELLQYGALDWIRLYVRVVDSSRCFEENPFNIPDISR